MIRDKITASMLLSLLLPIVLSANNHYSEEKSSPEDLTEVATFLKENPPIKDIASSFALARNEFENAINDNTEISDLTRRIHNIEFDLESFKQCKASANPRREQSYRRVQQHLTKEREQLTNHRKDVPAAFNPLRPGPNIKNAECPVKLRFNVVHYTEEEQSITETVTYKTNGHYKFLDASSPWIKELRERFDLKFPAFFNKMDLDAGVFLQDVPNGHSKGVTIVETSTSEYNNKATYLILKIRNDLPTRKPEARSQIEGRWAIIFIHSVDNPTSMGFVMCTALAECALPPAFARDWALTPRDWLLTRHATSVLNRVEECACDDEGSS